MAPLIAPNVARFSVIGTYSGRNWANVFDMRIQFDPLDPTSRGTYVVAQARDVLHAFDDRILPSLSNQLQAVQVNYVDLNSAEGVAGFVQTGGGDTWPKAGGQSGQCMPGNVSVLATKIAPGGGRRTRNGRTYIVGASETITDVANPSLISTASVADFTTKFEGFSSDISNTIIGEGYSSNMVVVHTHNAGTVQDPDIVYDGYSDVTSFICQQRLATQRRRLRK